MGRGHTNDDEIPSPEISQQTILCSRILVGCKYPLQCILHSPLSLIIQYLGEEGKNTPFIAASAISNPWSLRTATENLDHSYLGRELYSKTMAANLKRVFMRQYAVMKDHPKIDWKAVKNAKFVQGTVQYLNSDVRIRRCGHSTCLWTCLGHGLLYHRVVHKQSTQHQNSTTHSQCSRRPNCLYVY